ncbi:NAD(P)/FAD-dependent oxidoreductase [Parasulfitobacter algicola]|uniref:FAD-binding oxidoreductase n=1 Tax=Parasulfitobacter algicola TaxID=2614809 RepID=A0ABX2ISD0_9RHOB|nr:FAD-binding oxidoreductase [Sulfitobacter algicola]NSX55801.1 FAD-binding oxidoreductase [Sulfitobacter algicola]
MIKYDVLIIGGAITGSSVAYWLSRLDPNLRILVVEKDLQYRFASTALSVASIRQQFTTRVNVQISQFGVAFLKDIQTYLGCDPIPVTENGYLFLTSTRSGASTLRQVADIQNDLGAETALLSPRDLSARFPWMTFDDITLGSLGLRDEGWFDNMSLLGAFKMAAKHQGVVTVQDTVCGLYHKQGRITEVTLQHAGVVQAGAFVNAAGTSAASILQMLGDTLPVEPRKRTVFLIDAPKARYPNAPLMIDPQGYYLRPEHDRWLCAVIPKDDQATHPDDFEPEHQQFEGDIWPALYARSSAFEQAKVVGLWAGHYAYNTLDQNAIVGQHPHWLNLYLANGFSGHGLQQAPAIGRGLAELICHGTFRSLDLSDLDVERVLSETPFPEIAIV